MFCRNRKCQADIPDDALYCQYCGRRQEPTPRKGTRRPNKTGSVFYMGDGRKRPWRVQKDGVTIGYAETKTDGMKILERLTDKNVSDKFNMTFSEVYDEWCRERFRELTTKGAEGYINAYKHFQPLYNKSFRTLRTKDYQEIVDALIASGKSTSLANKLKQLIGQMSKWAMREDIVSTNYAPFIKLPPDKAKDKEIFTDSDITKLTEENSETAKIVLMLIYTGARIGELFGAELENYHETYFIGGSKTEAGKNRVIPIPEKARPLFAHFVGLENTTPFILGGYSGNLVVNNFRKRDFADLMKSLDIQGKTPHSTRHTFTTRAVSNNVRPEHLQKILGHASYSTTVDIYSHSDAFELVSAVEKMW